MIINEIPEVITFDDINEDTNEVISVTAQVMFISTKYVQAENGSGGESFVVMCYDNDNNIHELFLNQVKILKTKKYDKRSTWDSAGKRRRRKSNPKGNNHPGYKEVDSKAGEGTVGGNRNEG